MLGLMQSDPVNLISILQHAARWHTNQEVVTNSVEGEIRRQTYAETMARLRNLRQASRNTVSRLATE